MRTPRMLAIEPTNRCNLKCKGCPQHDGGDKAYPVGEMPPELWSHIRQMLKDFRETGRQTSVAFWLDGEPFLHPDYLKMAGELDTLVIPWTITTNGTLFTEDVIKKLLTFKNLYQIIFSIDGLFFDTWEKLRPGLNPRETWENIAKFMYYRMAESRTDIRVGAKIVDKGQDYEEIEGFVHYYVGQFDYVVVGKSLDRITDTCLRKFPCRYFDDMLLEIRWDGCIIPCSYNIRAAHGDLIDLGFIQNYESIIDAYNSDKYSALRQQHYTGKWPEPCNRCGFSYCGDGFIGRVKTRRPDRYSDRELFVHNDYYNTVYSLEEPKGGSSFLRPWFRDNDERG